MRKLEFENGKFSVLHEPGKGKGKVYISSDKALADLKDALRHDREVELLHIDLSQKDNYGNYSAYGVSWNKVAKMLAKGEM